MFCVASIHGYWGYQSRRRWLLQGTWCYLWFTVVHQCPPSLATCATMTEHLTVLLDFNLYIYMMMEASSEVIWRQYNIIVLILPYWNINFRSKCANKRIQFFMRTSASLISLLSKNRSTEGCSKLKCPETRQVYASPKVGQDQVSGGVSVLCWHAAPVANVLWKPLAIR